MFGRKKYEQLIPRLEREALERVLMMDEGYLLNFTDRTFNDFFYETLKIDPETETHLFNGRGTSKAKRLRSFLERAQPALAAKVLRSLWDSKEHTEFIDPTSEKDRNAYFSVIARLEGDDANIDTTEIETFEPNETLEELVASIKRDLDAKRPSAALDRLHTYCMKRYAALILENGGERCGNDDPLHSRVGKYVKLLKERRVLTPMSERIIKSSISAFEKFNPIRNDKSLAHDNEVLLSTEEARFIFDSVTAILRFTKAIDGAHFED